MGLQYCVSLRENKQAGQTHPAEQNVECSQGQSEKIENFKKKYVIARENIYDIVERLQKNYKNRQQQQEENQIGQNGDDAVKSSSKAGDKSTSTFPKLVVKDIHMLDAGNECVIKDVFEALSNKCGREKQDDASKTQMETSSQNMIKNSAPRLTESRFFISINEDQTVSLIEVNDQQLLLETSNQQRKVKSKGQVGAVGQDPARPPEEINLMIEGKANEQTSNMELDLLQTQLKNAKKFAQQDQTQLTSRSTYPCSKGNNGEKSITLDGSDKSLSFLQLDDEKESFLRELAQKTPPYSFDMESLIIEIQRNRVQSQIYADETVEKIRGKDEICDKRDRNNNVFDKTTETIDIQNIDSKDLLKGIPIELSPNAHEQPIKFELNFGQQNIMEINKVIDQEQYADNMRGTGYIPPGYKMKRQTDQKEKAQKQIGSTDNQYNSFEEQTDFIHVDQFSYEDKTRNRRVHQLRKSADDKAPHVNLWSQMEESGSKTSTQGSVKEPESEKEHSIGKKLSKNVNKGIKIYSKQEPIETSQRIRGNIKYGQYTS